MRMETADWITTSPVVAPVERYAAVWRSATDGPQHRA
jgi:hypothetical protein